MSEPADVPEGPMASAADWKIALDCGHFVRVPFGAPVPFVTACIVRHHEVCPLEFAPELEPIAWEVPARPLARMLSA